MSSCKCGCHCGCGICKLKDNCNHANTPPHCAKPSVQNEEWEDEFWVKYHATWLKQGRTAEQSYGVTNFMTGQGAKMLEEARKQGQLEAYEKVSNLPVFANKHERKYQIGINEVWKQLVELKEEVKQD